MSFPGQEIDLLGEQLDSLGGSIIGLLHRGIEALDASPSSARRNRRVIITNTPKSSQATRLPPARSFCSSSSSSSSNATYRPSPIMPSASPSSSGTARLSPRSTASCGAADPSPWLSPPPPHSSSSSSILRSSSTGSSPGQRLPPPHAGGTLRGDDLEASSDIDAQAAASLSPAKGHARPNSDGSASSGPSTGSSAVAAWAALESLASQQSTPKLRPEETENPAPTSVCSCSKELECSCKRGISILCGHAESQIRRASSWKLKDQVEL